MRRIIILRAPTPTGTKALRESKRDKISKQRISRRASDRPIMPLKPAASDECGPCGPPPIHTFGDFLRAKRRYEQCAGTIPPALDSIFRFWDQRRFSLYLLCSPPQKQFPFLTTLHAQFISQSFCFLLFGGTDSE